MMPTDPIELAPLTGPRERDWLIPASIMTASLGLAALLLMPIAGYDHIPDYFRRFLNWMAYMFFGAMFLLTWQVLKLMRAGVEQPIAALKAQFAAKGFLFLTGLAGAMLAGIDMLCFMWIKPEVTAISPFWADKALANIDHALFRTDPWRIFEGLDLAWHAWAYSFFWAVAIMGTVVWLLAQKPSVERSASLISYFALWTIFGTIGQYLLSSAGPIFYQRAGFGDRFAELDKNIPHVTQAVSGYLWDFHSTHTLGVGAGISAMPSLHIATVCWIYLALRWQGSKLTPLAALFALYMWALSVALGWHYAVDGIVGAVGAVASRWASRAWLRRRSERVLIAANAKEMPAST